VHYRRHRRRGRRRDAAVRQRGLPGNVAEYGLIGTVETIHERIAAYEAAGVQELAVSFLNPFDFDLAPQVRRGVRPLNAIG
jgi:alkanesulfonate monooxygenase SsuD/methylene tetrahydromethanopterin reductase-like flavin-dependent oxidoreductase (luciferase family)